MNSPWLIFSVTKTPKPTTQPNIYHNARAVTQNTQCKKQLKYCCHHSLILNQVYAVTQTALFITSSKQKGNTWVPFSLFNKSINQSIKMFTYHNRNMVVHTVLMATHQVNGEMPQFNPLQNENPAGDYIAEFKASLHYKYFYRYSNMV